MQIHVTSRDQRQQVIDAELMQQGPLALAECLSVLFQRLAKPRQAVGGRAGQEVQRRFARQGGHRISLPSDGQTFWLARLLARARTTDPGVAVAADDLALLQYTGGTTGVAKGAMLTHRNLVANTLQVRAWFANLANPDGPDIVMGVLPLFHIYAMTTVMNFSIRGGGTMVLQPRFVLQDVLKAIHRERSHLLPGVPTMSSSK